MLLDKKSKSLPIQSNGKPTAKAYNSCWGVIIHGNDPEKTLPQDQAQVNLVCLIKTIVCKLSLLVKLIHIPGHQDKDTPRRLLTKEQKLNVDMDTFAKRTLRYAILDEDYTKCTFPCEPFHISLQGNKVIRSPTKALEESFSQLTSSVESITS